MVETAGPGRADHDPQAAAGDDEVIRESTRRVAGGATLHTIDVGPVDDDEAGGALRERPGWVWPPVAGDVRAADPGGGRIEVVGLGLKGRRLAARMREWKDGHPGYTPAEYAAAFSQAADEIRGEPGSWFVDLTGG